MSSHNGRTPHCSPASAPHDRACFITCSADSASKFYLLTRIQQRLLHVHRLVHVSINARSSTRLSISIDTCSTTTLPLPRLFIFIRIRHRSCSTTTLTLPRLLLFTHCRHLYTACSATTLTLSRLFTDICSSDFIAPRAATSGSSPPLSGHSSPCVVTSFPHFQSPPAQLAVSDPLGRSTRAPAHRCSETQPNARLRHSTYDLYDCRHLRQFAHLSCFSIANSLVNSSWWRWYTSSMLVSSLAARFILDVAV
jgi:hypothetical protein